MNKEIKEFLLKTLRILCGSLRRLRTTLEFNYLRNLQGLFQRMDWHCAKEVFTEFEKSVNRFCAVPWWIWMLFTLEKSTLLFYTRLLFGTPQICMKTLIRCTNTFRVTITDKVYEGLRNKKSISPEPLEWIMEHRCAGCLVVSEKCTKVPLVIWDGYYDKQDLYWSRRMFHVVCGQECADKLRKSICECCMCIRSYQYPRGGIKLIKLKVERGTKRRFCSVECQRVFHKGPRMPRNSDYAYQVD